MDYFLEYIENGKQEILEFCRQKDFIFLYGAGKFGESFQKVLDTMGIKISGYLISDDQELPHDKAFPVYHLSKLPIVPEKCGIFLTLNRDYHAGILNYLNAKGFNTVYPRSLGNEGDAQTIFMGNALYLMDPRFYSTFAQLLAKNQSGVDAQELNFGSLRLPNFVLENPKLAPSILLECFDIAFPGIGYNDFLLEGPYEYGQVKIAPDDIVFDCGANIGMFSAYAAEKILPKEGAVYAFEPMENVRSLLEKTRMIYPDAITIIPYAVSNKAGIAHFLNTGFCGSLTSSENRSDIQVEVHTISLDEFVEKNQIHKVDFIKADIEGAERQMLIGAKNVLKTMAPKLALCTYHLPDDKEVMERLILEANPNYKIEHRWKKLYAYVPK